MEVANIYSVIGRVDLRTVCTRSAIKLACPVALLLLPGNPDEPEQQERFDR
jgi:hypothetical protein